MIKNFQILLILFTFKQVSTDDWLDTKVDLKQISQSILIDEFDQNLNDENAKIKSKLDRNDASKSIIINKTNDQNKIEDFEFNLPSDLNKDLNKNQTNSSSLKQQPKLYSLILDKDHLLTLFWTVNYEQKHILFELKFNLPNQVNSPFLAFGFSSYGQFENADLCVLWSNEQNKYHFQDTWTDSNGFLNLDKQNDCELLSTKKVANQIYILFKRKFNTCDKHDFKLSKGTNHLIYALGNGQLDQVYGLRLASIKRKGFIRASLFKSKQITPFLNPEDVRTIEFKTNEIIIPSVETTYWCKIHKIPDLFKEKQHIVRYESVIQNGNENLVHHMELFHCEVESKQEMPNYNGPCTGPLVPPVLSRCKKVIAAWAMGASAISYPLEAGLSAGGVNYSLYVMQETHYNNPELISNRVDSSGLRLYFTNKLRKHDIGILEIGLEYSAKNSIPPGQNNFELQGYCVSECTRIGLPDGGINVVASQLHTHLTGVKVFTKHYREGKELEELNRDDYYSTHFQEIRLLDKPVNVQPGDALVNHCVFNTLDRKNITLGGYGINDEMCVNYIHYYPRIDLEVCKSSVDTSDLFNYFNYLKRTHNQPISLVNNSEQLDEIHVTSAYQSIHWNQYQVQLLKEFYNQSPLSHQCNRSSGDRFPGNWNGIPITSVFHRREPDKDECSLDQL